MAYVRLSLATSPPDRRAEVRQYYQELVAYASSLPGFVTGWVVAGSGDAEIGRLAVWETESAAHRAANDPHLMALHAQVQFAVSGNLWDRSFETDPSQTDGATGARDMDPAAVLRAVEAMFQQRPQ